MQDFISPMQLDLVPLAIGLWIQMNEEIKKCYLLGGVNPLTPQGKQGLLGNTRRV